ncbi:cyclase family protein [Chryseobacterium sp.]|uniref:cyclase family protein n=1 Tax=Chryseobacterium sp. TaxID=1871047 RepID=UPI0025C511FD|nr:cyclase family protein [Chryseobacterium sp.]MBV8327307.1 cyclase family protein [Chryseobacterium sp.]
MEKNKNTRYVETGYPIYEGMPVYPGLPKVKVELRESLDKGDDWNGSVLSMYLHAGTHVDAPRHHISNALGIDQVPIENFFYQHPLLIDIPEPGKDYLITIDDIKRYHDLNKYDILIFNTQSYKKRNKDFMSYANGFPTVSPETAEYIREHLPNIKAVAIDTLSIENIALGKDNGFRTHKAFLDPERVNGTILIYEDVNIAPIVGKKLVSACCTPLRIVGGDASNCNLVFEIQD